MPHAPFQVSAPPAPGPPAAAREAVARRCRPDSSPTPPPAPPPARGPAVPPAALGKDEETLQLRRWWRPVQLGAARAAVVAAAAAGEGLRGPGCLEAGSGDRTGPGARGPDGAQRARAPQPPRRAAPSGHGARRCRLTRGAWAGRPCPRAAVLALLGAAASSRPPGWRRGDRVRAAPRPFPGSGVPGRRAARAVPEEDWRCPVCAASCSRTCSRPSCFTVSSCAGDRRSPCPPPGRGGSRVPRRRPELVCGWSFLSGRVRSSHTDPF